MSKLEKQNIACEIDFTSIFDIQRIFNAIMKLI